MSFVSNKNHTLSRLLPLFKEHSSINDQVEIKSSVSELFEQQIKAQWKKGELGNLRIPKSLTGDSSKPVISNDTENMAHESNNEVSHSSYPALSSKDFPNLPPMTSQEGEFWDSRSKSDRRILESTEPALPGDLQREMGVSRWQKLKKQFKKFKDALSCASQNSVSEECSIPTSPLTQLTEPSSLMSASIVTTSTKDSKPDFQDDKSDTTPNQSLFQNTETEVVADVKTGKNDGDKGSDDIFETQENTPEPDAVPFKRSSAEESFEEMPMECSEPNLPSVSAIGKYWDNHPISQSCRNIFRANKPILEETIIHRGRTSPWKVLKSQPVFEKQWKNKMLGSSRE